MLPSHEPNYIKRLTGKNFFEFRISSAIFVLSINANKQTFMALSFYFFKEFLMYKGGSVRSFNKILGSILSVTHDMSSPLLRSVKTKAIRFILKLIFCLNYGAVFRVCIIKIVISSLIFVGDWILVLYFVANSGLGNRLVGKLKNSSVSYSTVGQSNRRKTRGIPRGVVMVTNQAAGGRGHKIQTYLINLRGRSISCRDANVSPNFILYTKPRQAHLIGMKI